MKHPMPEALGAAAMPIIGTALAFALLMALVLTTATMIAAMM